MLTVIILAVLSIVVLVSLAPWLNKMNKKFEQKLSKKKSYLPLKIILVVVAIVLILPFIIMIYLLNGSYAP
jgi:uncharacterized membrane protein YdjX (TVP38/TMEM64 family)